MVISYEAMWLQGELHSVPVDVTYVFTVREEQ